MSGSNLFSIALCIFLFVCATINYVNSVLSLDSINFLETPPRDIDHKYYYLLKNSQSNLINLGFDFFSYKELFERWVCEKLISCGERDVLEIRYLPLNSGEDVAHKIFPNIMGINLHAFRRVKLLEDFFNAYLKSGEYHFFKNKEYLLTSYFQVEIIPNVPFNFYKPRSVMRQRLFMRIAHERINMLKNFQDAGNQLVGNSKSKNPKSRLYYYDLPWAIDYLGYVKLRDGAHRRSIMKYLGRNSIETIVVNFDKIDDRLLNKYQVNECLTLYFSLFKNIVSELSPK